MGGPDMAPYPPTFVAPRETRGAPRYSEAARVSDMADRKYRQQGYQSYQNQGAGRRDPPRPPASDGPRGGGMLAKHTVSRCGGCGAVLPVATASLQECPNCRAAIHA